MKTPYYMNSIDVLFKKEEEIYGTLTPIAWSVDGKAQKFSVFNSAGDVLIEKDFPINRLRALSNKSVVAFGRTWTSLDGEKHIELTFIEPIDESGFDKIDIADEFKTSCDYVEYPLGSSFDDILVG